MANWSDVLYLVSLDKGIDDDGFEVILPGEPRKIYANKKSVRSQEFHMAKQQGITLSYMFEIRTNEYKGEETLIHNGNEQTVYRSYEKGEFIELICHRKDNDYET